MALNEAVLRCGQHRWEMLELRIESLPCTIIWESDRYLEVADSRIRPGFSKLFLLII